jgi:tetratricopeptide (TPR) repeat protein
LILVFISVFICVHPWLIFSMSRFSKLDFDTAPTPLQEQPDRWPDRDEAGCLKSGDEQFYRGLYEPALNLYSRALRFNRDSAAAWVGQIRCLIEMGEFPEAVTWSDRAQERFPNQPDILACKGLALIKMLETEEGQEYSDGAVQLKAPSPWVWLARGESLLLTKQPAANVHRCFLKALEYSSDADVWRSELRIGMAYNRARQFTLARPHLQNALRGAPTNELALYELGLAQEALGEVQLAIGYFERACHIRRFPEAADALRRAQHTNPISQWWRRMTQK